MDRNPGRQKNRRSKEIRRSTRRQFSAEEKIRIVLSGLRGEDSIAELCRREGIVQNLYYRWSKEFLEAGKKRLAGDTARAATIRGRNRNCRGPADTLVWCGTDRRSRPLLLGAVDGIGQPIELARQVHPRTQGLHSVILRLRSTPR